MKVEPYLSFDGRCDEAIAFYTVAVGAKVGMVSRFKECPDPKMLVGMSPEMTGKVMHASLQIGESMVLISDGQCRGKLGFHGFSLSVTAADDAEAARMFNALAEGGQITMPLNKTFFASSFGMLTDRFGLGWMVIAGQ